MLLLTTFCAIAERAADAPVQVHAACGVTGVEPHESTIRRVLQALDANTPEHSDDGVTQQA